MVNPPSGNVTFLYTDIEGSTKLAQKYVDTYNQILAKHDTILREAIKSNNGFVFRTVGDGFCASFNNVKDAIKAAVDAQLGLLKAENGKFEVKVRIGIHTGAAEYQDNDYIGYMTLSRANRVMSAANGGQIIVSNDSYIASADKISSSITFRDLGERRLKDMIRPIRLFQIQAPELPDDFPPLKTLDARPNNLPVQLTSFIGRDKDIENAKLLLKENHLVTLVGTGGVGKTRLSLQLGADLIDEFDHGVWFIDLTLVRSEQLLMEKILSTLKIKEEQKISTEETLLNYLKPKQILLIFDNCEHLINIASRLIEVVLSNCPDLTILATSREALRCTGEQTYHVNALPIPEKNIHLTTKKLTQYEAVKLFIERARSVHPSFKVNNDNAPALAEICSKLEGIPLAIELAAARTNILSLEKINERLNNRFQLLTGGKRTSLPKQQTLKALIDWSYDLLNECEKLLFMRLSIFRKGWTLEAAEGICSHGNLAGDEVLDLLSQLYDKSLITYSNDTGRYDILESLRQYAESCLDHSGEKDLIKEKHQKYYVALASSYSNNKDQIAKLEQINLVEKDHYNFQIALYNFIEDGKYNDALHLAFLLARYLEVKGYYSEGLRWFNDILSHKEDLSLNERARALQWAGIFEWIKGDFSRANMLLGECLSIRRELDDKRGIASTLHNLGLVALDMNDFSKAVEYHEKALEILENLGDKILLSDAHLNYASSLFKTGDLKKAEEILERCLKIYWEIKDRRGISMALTNLGSIAMYLSDYKKSLRLFDEALKIQKEIDYRGAMAMTLNNIGTITGFQGDLKKAEHVLEESVAIHRELTDSSSLANALNNLGFVKFLSGKTEAALKLHRESLKIRSDINDDLGELYSLLGVAETIAKSRASDAAILAGFINLNTRSLEQIAENEIRDKYHNLIKNLNQNMTAAEFQNNFNKGRELDMKAAVELGMN